MHVLFVEDNLEFARVALEHFLSGIEVKLAGTVGEALENLGSRFDAILVDFDLPDGKGDSVVASFRARYPELHIIATSAHYEGNLALRAAGANATCKKADFRQIGQLLRNWVTASAAHEE